MQELSLRAYALPLLFTFDSRLCEARKEYGYQSDDRAGLGGASVASL